jgi:DNA-binding HxlR family transcriptional regulator
MRRTSVRDLNCSIAQCLEVVGDWWSLLIVRDCLFGVRRFDQLQSRLQISRNVLTQRLEWLVEQGVLERRPYQERPVRHEYVLTEKGRSLWRVLEAMRTWGDRWYATDGPPVESVHTGCGSPTHGRPVCEQCGEPLHLRDLTARPGPGATEACPVPVAAR